MYKSKSPKSHGLAAMWKLARGLQQGKQNSSLAARLFAYPVGRDPASLRSVLAEKLDPKAASLIDGRPISLRFRVSSLIELSELDKAAQVSRLAVLKQYHGWDTKVMMCNEIIGTMCEAKRHDDAVALFHHFFNENNEFDPDIISFNHILQALCNDNRVDDALELYLRSSINVLKDIDTLRILTKGLIDTGRIFDALSFVEPITELRDSVVCSYLIRGFLDLGNHGMAYQISDLFNHNTKPVYDYGYNRLGFMQGFMSSVVCGDKRRAVLDATFLDYWLSQGEDEKAMDIYRSIMSRIGEEVACAATGNTLLGILLHNGKQTEAWDLFNAMLTNSKTFDRDTFRTMVDACFKLGHFKEALETFKRPELTRSSRCYANIIARFCDRGMMSEAQDLFHEMRSYRYLRPDVATFRSMINGYAKAGRVDEAIQMLKKMVDATLLKVAVHEAH